MITWSVVAAALGLCGTGALVADPSSPWRHYSPERCWLLGMAALFPAWLIAFLGLLAPSGGSIPKIVVIGSSSAPLLGIIITDAVVRHLRHSSRNHSPITYWFLGVAAVLPGWGLALLALSLIGMTK